jgi:hypothetical protein
MHLNLQLHCWDFRGRHSDLLGLVQECVAAGPAKDLVSSGVVQKRAGVTKSQQNTPEQEDAQVGFNVQQVTLKILGSRGEQGSLAPNDESDNPACPVRGGTVTDVGDSNFLLQ